MANLFRCGGGGGAKLYFVREYTIEKPGIYGFSVKDIEGVNYKNLTVDNFIVEIKEIPTRSTMIAGTQSPAFLVNLGCTFEKTYSSSSGTFSISFNLKIAASRDQNGTSNVSTLFCPTTFRIYLVA